MRITRRIALVASMVLCASFGFAQEALDSSMVWHHKSPKDGIQGVSTEEAYKFLQEKGRKSSPIVVAIIDSGTDIEHEDLKAVRWVNADEIPDNGIDDDKNGYIDDVNGWNFIGGKDGKNITNETLEVTRIYRDQKDKYEGKTIDSFKTEAEKKAFLMYKATKNLYEKSVDKASGEFNMVMQIWMADSLMGDALGKVDYDLADLQGLQTEDEQIKGIGEMLLRMFENGLTRHEIVEYKEYVDKKVKYQLNLDFDPRAEIIGDDTNDTNDRNYGNNDVIGASCEHGTHVAGIVAAVRGNGVGMDGIADNVQIMSVRTVPDGDERDKDVANAIRYAVDNGAKILNMSFGKSTATHKDAVDAALLYAQEKGVLLVHAAGNDGKNLDTESNFPTPVLNSGKVVKNWLTVGATDQLADSSMMATFSNYGKKMVDIFAPGVNVYSTYPNNEYKKNSGTSMASPVVAGVAALVWSYYPNFTAEELRKILVKSAEQHKKLVLKRPLSEEEKEGELNGIDTVIKFKKLGHKAGVVNAFNAVQLAEKKYK